jgi:hypothetical protein
LPRWIPQLAQGAGPGAAEAEAQLEALRGEKALLLQRLEAAELSAKDVKAALLTQLEAAEVLRGEKEGILRQLTEQTAQLTEAERGARDEKAALLAQLEEAEARVKEEKALLLKQLGEAEARSQQALKDVRARAEEQVTALTQQLTQVGTCHPAGRGDVCLLRLSRVDCRCVYAYYACRRLWRMCIYTLPACQGIPLSVTVDDPAGQCMTGAGSAGQAGAVEPAPCSPDARFPAHQAVRGMRGTAGGGVA